MNPVLNPKNPNTLRRWVPALAATLLLSGPASADLLALYRFEDASAALGASVADSSVYGHDGKVAGSAIEFVPGRSGFGNAARFTTANGFVTAALPVGGTVGDFAIAFWMKPESLAGSAAYVTARNLGGSQLAAIWEYANNRVELFFGGGAGPNPRPGSGVEYVDTEWKHLVYTRSGSQYACYVDGVKTEIGTLAGDFTNVAQNVLIGAANMEGAGRFAGLLDDVAWFSHGLDQGQVNAIRAGDFSAFIPDPALTVPAQIDLGTVAMSSSPIELSLQVANLGTSQVLNVTGLTFDGADGAAFAAGALPTGIAAQGGTGDVRFTFKPELGAGAYNATARLLSNDPRGPVTVNLSVQVEGGPQLVTPTRVDLEPIRTTQASAGGQFTVRNAAKATPLVISQIVLEGIDGAQFTVSNFPATLQPGGEGIITLNFSSPGKAGTYGADCVIHCNDPASPVVVPVDIIVSSPPVGANAYQQAVIDHKPLLYWTFDEAEPSANAVDKIWGLPTNDLDAQGSAGRVASTLGLGNAADFDGVAGGRFFANTLKPGAASYSHYAIEMWVRLEQPASRTYLLEGWGVVWGADNAPSIIHGFNPNLEAFFGGGGGRTGSGGPATLADTEWHHLVMEVNATAKTHTFYIDGEPTGTFAGARAWLPPALGVGSAAANTDSPLNGQIDELAFYDLTGGTVAGQDIANHFNANVTVPDPILTVSPRIDLGTVAESASPIELTFEVSNLGATRTLNVTSLTFGGPDAAAFTAGQLPTAIAPNGGTGTVGVTFKTDFGPGTYSATATLESNAPGGAVIVNLTLVVEEGPQLEVPARIELAPIRTTQDSAGGQFVVRNRAKATALEISEVTFDGPNGAQFAVSTFPSSLPPGGEGTLSFTFDSPGVAGIYTAECLIHSNAAGSPATVQVEIMVAAPPVGANAYQQAVIGHGPLLYWTFDESEPAANAVDKIWGIPANDLRPQGSAGRTANPLGLGNAANFDGVRGSRFFTDTLRLGATSYSHYAIEMWVRLEDPVKRAYLFEGWSGVPAGTNAPALIHGFNPNLELFGGSGGRTGSAGPQTLKDMGWHHVVMEINVPANTHRFFIDGQPAGEFAGSRAWLLPALAIGSPAVNTDEPMIGQIDELAIYDLAGGTITGQDLAAHSQATGGGGNPNLRPTVDGFDPATSTMRLKLGTIPAGRTFHLRGSTDLKVFTPLTPPVNIDSSTPQPVVIPTSGERRFFIQVFEGQSP